MIDARFVQGNLRHAVNGRLSSTTHVSDADRALIESRANDADPSQWSSIEDLDKRIRARLA